MTEAKEFEIELDAGIKNALRTLISISSNEENANKHIEKALSKNEQYQNYEDIQKIKYKTSLVKQIFGLIQIYSMPNDSVANPIENIQSEYMVLLSTVISNRFI